MKPVLALVLALAALIALPGEALAQWHDRKGNALPETDRMQSEDGFAAMLIITDDADWEAKWNTPPETTPEFRAADSVKLGDSLSILVVLANPGRDANDMADVRCDFSLARPDGSLSLDLKDQPCFQAEIKGDPNNLRMTRMSLRFLSEAGDQKGRYTVKVSLHDMIGGSTLNLTDSFNNQ